MLRPILFRLHRWVGLVLGAYFLFIGATGAALVFRQELQRAAYPEFHRLERGGAPLAAPDTVVRALADAYPGARVSGIDWPTYRRDSFLAYVTDAGRFRTVFAHPVSGRVIGELPYDWIRRLQDLHFDLVGGRTGRVLNGVGALCLLVAGISGLHLWSRRRLRDVHRTIGILIVPLLIAWAVTGAYYAFPQPLRSVVNALMPLTAVQPPRSLGRASGTAAVVTPEALIARARAAVPGAQMARLVWPFGERGTYQIVLARAVHGDADTSDEVTLYFDAYSGALLLTRDHRARTTGDVVTAWIGPLHFGSFGGLPVKMLWAAAGLGLPLLFVTGVRMWRRRV